MSSTKQLAIRNTHPTCSVLVSAARARGALLRESVERLAVLGVVEDHGGAPAPPRAEGGGARRRARRRHAPSRLCKDAGNAGDQSPQQIIREDNGPSACREFRVWLQQAAGNRR